MRGFKLHVIVSLPGYLITTSFPLDVAIEVIEAIIAKSMESEKHSTNCKERRKTDYQFDDLLIMTGGFGRYQMVLYAFICLVSIPTGFQLSIPVFYAVSPPFACAVSNDTCPVGECCSGCWKYEFTGTFTSAVSEVRLVYSN